MPRRGGRRFDRRPRSPPRRGRARPLFKFWTYLLSVVGFHLLLPLVCVPWLFSWTGLLLVPVALTISLHRWESAVAGITGWASTHRSYNCPKWLEHLFALFGICALQDSPARWVVIHRLHHQHSDHQADPHSPKVSWFWGHMGWLFVENPLVHRVSTFSRHADLLKDRFYFRLERNATWVWVYAAHVVLFYLAGFAIGLATTGTWMAGVQFGLSLVLYGVVVRTGRHRPAGTSPGGQFARPHVRLSQLQHR